MAVRRPPGRSLQALRFWLLALVLAGMTIVAVPLPAEAANIYVSLTFDDGRASQRNADHLLTSLDVKGTFYINSAQLGTSGYYMTLPHVQTIASHGHEVGGHTLNHVGLTDVDAATAAHQVCADQQQLQAWGFPAVSFAYPQGTQNASVQDIVKDCRSRGYDVSQNYTSARRIGGLQCSGCSSAESVPPSNPYAVRTPGGSPTASTTLDQLKSKVTTARSSGSGWIVIPFHSVCGAPGDAPIPGDARDCNDTYSISYSNLDQFVQWLKGEAGSGTLIKTVSEVMQASTPPSGANLVQNPSLEADADLNDAPDCFKRAGYGASSYSFTRVDTGAHSGTYAEKVTVTSLTSGDRKVVTAQDTGGCTMAATPARTYDTSIWFTSDERVRIAAYYHDAAGWHWWAESPYSAASSTWKQSSWTTPPMPAGADRWSFGPALTSVGTMTVDDFSATAS